MRIFEVEPLADVIVENRSAAIGKIIFFESRRPIVVCGRGLLRLIDFRSENGESLVGRIPFRSRFEGRR